MNRALLVLGIVPLAVWGIDQGLTATATDGNPPSLLWNQFFNAVNPSNTYYFPEMYLAIIGLVLVLIALFVPLG